MMKTQSTGVFAAQGRLRKRHKYDDQFDLSPRSSATAIKSFTTIGTNHIQGGGDSRYTNDAYKWVQP